MDYHGSLEDCHNVTLFVEENLNLHEFRFRSVYLVPKEDKQHFFIIIISKSASSVSLSTYVNDNLNNKFSLP